MEAKELQPRKDSSTLQSNIQGSKAYIKDVSIFVKRIKYTHIHTHTHTHVIRGKSRISTYPQEKNLFTQGLNNVFVFLFCLDLGGKRGSLTDFNIAFSIKLNRRYLSFFSALFWYVTWLN